jgi:hypothetical protein
MRDLDARLAEAVRYFWSVQKRQDSSQGRGTGQRDQGRRAAVTGGRHCTGFANVVRDRAVEAGLPDAAVYYRRDTQGSTVEPAMTSTELPGYFRATKNWDLLIVAKSRLIAVVEFKSHIGSLGNNQNNRVEEAVGNAKDFWTAYREGAFAPSGRPWVGYFLMLEDTPRALVPVRVKEPHFNVFAEFRDASYVQRYVLLCQRLVRERLYDAACLVMSNAETGVRGVFREPSPECSFRDFAMSLTGRVVAFTRMIDSSER